MLVEASSSRSIPDCEFFINKRDYPHLKVNVERGEPVEPYGFIYGRDDRDPAQDIDLHPSHKYETYAPIMSFYASSPDRFADIPFPSSEDWEGACGEVFCNTFIYHERDSAGRPVFDSHPRDLFTEENFQKFSCGWTDKVNTAFFRGTATGGGVTTDDNQRLKVASLSHEWSSDAEKGGDVPFCDAAIVGWNMRDKKVHDKPMTFLRKSSLGFSGGRQHFTPIYKQSRYKYLIYVDGHCAACRYGFMMRLGSVILKVASRQVADTMWYFPLLCDSGPLQDHVPVKEDLSDLEDKIRWCRNNDDRCKVIAGNCKRFYDKYVAREGLLDYLELVCKEVAGRFKPAPVWWSSTSDFSSAGKDDGFSPSIPPGPHKCFNTDDGDELYCLRCQGLHDAKRAEEEAERRRKEEESVEKLQSKGDLRERMLKRRRKNKEVAATAAAAAKK